ncbi:hypothetical protein EYR38_008484 [Pleurotus pulmonarius]|nr:hypothetical protein EYR38_008484 [Pleurotus pulmonarius]
MDASISSSSRVDQNASRILDSQYDRPQEDGANGRSTQVPGNERERREAFSRELEIASEKERQLQAENDLLLDTLAVAMAPPQMEYRTSHPSAPGDIPLLPRDVHSPAPEAPALPTNGLRDSRHVPRSNGALNGSATNGSSGGLHEVREPAEPDSHEEKQERH